MTEPIELPEWARRAQADAASVRESEPAAKPSSPAPAAALSGPKSREYVREILAGLSPSRADAYDDWRTVGMCIHAENPAYLDLWEEWSRLSGKYKEGECARKWQSFGRNSGLSFGSVVHLARQDSGNPDLGKGARAGGGKKSNLPEIPEGDHGAWVDEKFPDELTRIVKLEGLERDREGLKLFQSVVEALDGAPVLTKARVQQAICAKDTGLGLTKPEYNLAIKQARAAIERERAEKMGSDYRPASVKFFGEGDATDWPQIARTFIAEFEGAIRFWKGEWFVWTKKLACYRAREEKNFKAMLVRWLTLKGVNVTVTAVNNLQMALLGPCELDSSIDRPNWIWAECTDEMGLDPEGKYLAFTNGIFNVLRPDDPCLPHDPRFWSHVCLPYDFNPEATCPEFLAALALWHPPFELVTEDDDAPAWKLLAACPRHCRRVQLAPDAALTEPSLEFNEWIEKAPDGPPADCPEMREGVRYFTIETQHIIQEFAGYLYEPLNPHNVFMLNYGPGGDGKSQLAEIYTALVGVENTSGLGLEAFDPHLTHALMDLPGKLLNVTGDTAEMDKVAEGQIKAMTGGDRVNIQRKYLSPLNEIIGTKFVMNCNTLPPFRDRTEGIWRRMLLIQWESVPVEKRIPALAQKLIAKEISGIFNWALAGFHRQRHHGFSKGVVLRSSISRGKTLVHKEINFFDEEIGIDLPGIERGSALTEVHKDDVTRAYKNWCDRNNQKKGLYGDNMIGELRKWLMRNWPTPVEKLERKKKAGGLGGLLQRATSGDRAYTRLVGVYLKRTEEKDAASIF
ncbi:MAG: PriCT-2 domain-containing protein [Planctomycetota bacterium]|nr:PriCT-2 domain-containing protein [Planctomycetota bacterium]